jgi:hypothetical protein
MRQTQASGAGCLLRALRAYLAFVLVSVVVAVSAGYWASGRAVRRAEAAWAEAGEPMEAFIARYPPQPDSPATRKLDALARPMGIEILGPIPRETPERKAQGARLQAVGRALGECARAGSDDCPPLPEDTQALVSSEAARLDAIETEILEGGPLHWAQDFAKGMASPLPHLLGHRYLQSLLLARAQIGRASGHPELAERPLEASFVLNASLVERPEIISRLLAVSIAGMERGVLRLLPQPLEKWQERLRADTFPQPLRIPFQLEALNWTRFTTGPWGIFDVSYMEDGETPPRTPFGSAGAWLTAPYVRLSFAGISEALLRESRALESEARCDLDVDRRAKEFEDSFPRWNILGRIATPSLVRSLAAFRHAELDRELTYQVLLARAERRNSGRWPTASVASGVCEGLRWDEATAADGTLTVRISEQPFRQPDNGWDWSIRLHP